MGELFGSSEAEHEENLLRGLAASGGVLRRDRRGASRARPSSIASCRATCSSPSRRPRRSTSCCRCSARSSPTAAACCRTRRSSPASTASPAWSGPARRPTSSPTAPACASTATRAKCTCSCTSMTEVVPLVEAHEDSRFGAKATGLGAAARAGLPIPPGIALSGALVDAVAAGQRRRDRTGAHEAAPAAARHRSRCARRRPTRTAPTRASPASTSRCSTCRRSTTCAPRSARSGGRPTPTPRSPTGSGSACSPDRASAWSCSRCSIADAAGVMFTQNPINGADENG